MSLMIRSSLKRYLLSSAAIRRTLPRLV